MLAAEDTNARLYNIKAAVAQHPCAVMMPIGSIHIPMMFSTGSLDVICSSEYAGASLPAQALLTHTFSGIPNH